MENRNIKVIDEHNIDRVANVICAIDVDGSNYIIYSIERDSDNDNIFISKLINNINNTVNIINIDDSMEKEKMAFLVKELIKYAIDNDSFDQNNKKVVLSGGKIVNIISVIVDKKEQNINVKKTYITTVKKAVTKVSETFYNISSDELNVDSQIKNVFPNFELSFDNDKVVPLPDIIPNSEELNKEDSGDIVSEINTIDSTIPNIINPVIENISNIESGSIPIVHTITPDSVNLNVDVVKAENDLIVESNDNNSNDLSKTILPDPILFSQNSDIKTQPLPFSMPNSSTINEDVNDDKIDSQMNSQNSNSLEDNNMMVFDGSKESNLNEALGEVSNDKIISTDNVESFREFGVDEVKESDLPKEVSNVTNTFDSDTKESNDSSKTAGFVNNKYFMVISILFFVAACVFLGYEAFNYFRLVK